MKKSVFTSYDELPLLLNVKQLADLLGVSDSSVYELIQEDDFPSLRIGKRIVIPERGTAQVDLRSHEGGAVMLSSQYAQKEKAKEFLPAPNALFDIELHINAVAIYAYLIRIEDRNTYQCIVSYSTIAKKLGIAPNTVAKYVRQLEEKGLIYTEHTEIVTKDGLKRNGCLKYTILKFDQAVDQYYEKRMEELSLLTAQQTAQAKAEKLGVEFIPVGSDRSA